MIHLSRVLKAIHAANCSGVSDQLRFNRYLIGRTPRWPESIAEDSTAVCKHCTVQNHASEALSAPDELRFSDVVETATAASRAPVGVAARSIAGLDEGVSLPRFRMLVLLCRQGPQRITDLAKAPAVNPSTAMRMSVRRLAKGLVSRYRTNGDRRSAWTNIVPSGRLLVEKVMTRRHAEIAAIVETMPLKTRMQMLDALGSFADAAGGVPHQSSAEGWA